MEGWIKIHRKLLDWEWYDEPNVFRLFIHLLLKANHKSRSYRGVTIKSGQVMTGFDKLAKELGMSVQNVRTSLDKLILTNEVTKQSNSHGTIIQVVKYKDYQLLTSEVTSKLTDNQQTTNKQLTTNKNVNKDKNVNNKKTVFPFIEFWELYNNKKDRTKSESKYNNVSEKDRTLIKATLPIYIKETPDIKFRKHPTTYLNNKSWLDETNNKTAYKSNKLSF